MPTTKPTLTTTVLNTLEHATGTAGWDTQVLDRDRWEQESIAGTGNDKISQAAIAETNRWHRSPNIVDNGGMEIWQRGIGPADATPGSVGLADGWKCDYGTWQQAGGETGKALQCVAVAAPYRPFCSQIILNMEQYKGRDVALYVRMGMDAGKWIQLNLQTDAGGVFNVPLQSANSGFQTFTARGTVPAGATNMTLYIAAAFDTTCVMTIDSVNLVPGLVPIPYRPDPPSVQWARARGRYGKLNINHLYYEVLTAMVQYIAVRWPSILAATPSAALTLTGTNGVDYGNLTSVTVTQIDDKGALITITGAGAAVSPFLRRQQLIYDLGVY